MTRTTSVLFDQNFNQVSGEVPAPKEGQVSMLCENESLNKNKQYFGLKDTWKWCAKYNYKIPSIYELLCPSSGKFIREVLISLYFIRNL